MRSKLREIAAFLAALLLFLCISWGAGVLLRPERKLYGSMWQAYRTEPRESIDVLFFGSSLVYCDVAPAWIWAESGLRSYVMAGPEQTIPISYYYIREACRTQSPQLIMMEVTGLFYQKYQNYTRANIDYMPLSANRLAATFTAAERELIPDLLYPLFSYHDRLNDIDGEELRRKLKPAADPLAGYTFLSDACPPPDYAERAEFTADSDAYRANLRWLERIRDFCEQHDTALLLYVAPSAGRIPAAAMELLRQDLSALGLSLADLNEALPELGIDDERDWYDFLHFNERGAEKFSRWLGAYLTAQPGIMPSEGEDAAWTEKLAYLETLAEEAELQGA